MSLANKNLLKFIYENTHVNLFFTQILSAASLLFAYYCQTRFPPTTRLVLPLFLSLTFLPTNFCLLIIVGKK